MPPSTRSPSLDHRFRPGLSLLVTLIIAGLSAGTANARTLTASPGTNTIQAKINAAGNGDVINLRPGAYTITRTVRVNKRVTIQAADGKNKPYLFNGAGLKDWSALMVVNGPGTGSTIRNVDFTRCQRGAAINIRDCANVTVANCLVKDCGSSGILMERAGNITIRNCTVRNCVLKAKPGYAYEINGWIWAAAVSCLEGSEITVNNNRIQRNYGEGILIQGVNQATVNGNTCSDNFSVNLYLNHVRGGTVRYNTVTSAWDQRYYRDGEPAFGIGVSNENETPYWTTTDDVLVADNKILNTKYGVWIPRQGWGNYAAPRKVRVNNNQFRNVWGYWILNGWGGNVTNSGNTGF